VARFEDREGLFGVEGDGLVGRVAVVVRGDELDGAMLRLVIDLGVHVGEVDWLIRVYVGWLAGCKMVTLFEREQSKLCGQYLIFFYLASCLENAMECCLCSDWMEKGYKIWWWFLCSNISYSTSETPATPLLLSTRNNRSSAPPPAQQK
jgi:hypothetical protein